MTKFANLVVRAEVLVNHASQLEYALGHVTDRLFGALPPTAAKGSPDLGESPNPEDQPEYNSLQDQLNLIADSLRNIEGHLTRFDGDTKEAGVAFSR